MKGGVGLDSAFSQISKRNEVARTNLLSNRPQSIYIRLSWIVFLCFSFSRMRERPLCSEAYSRKGQHSKKEYEIQCLPDSWRWRKTVTCTTNLDLLAIIPEVEAAWLEQLIGQLPFFGFLKAVQLLVRFHAYESILL